MASIDRTTTPSSATIRVAVSLFIDAMVPFICGTTNDCEAGHRNFDRRPFVECLTWHTCPSNETRAEIARPASVKLYPQIQPKVIFHADAVMAA